MGMNPTLAAMYDTHGAGRAARQEQTKIAHLDLFAKSAAANGINLAALDNNTRNALYREFSVKLAEEGGEPPPFAEKKEEEAAAEADEAAAEDHEEAAEQEEEAAEKEEDAAEEHEAAAGEKKEAHAQFRAMKAWQEKNAEADFLGRRMAHSFWNEYNEIQKEAQAGGARRAPQQKTASARKPANTKVASAFDIEAARHAVKLAQAGGWNGQEAVQRLEARLTLGAPPVVKTASALNDYGSALGVRALELLEASGYPVDWTQVFGK